MKSFAEIKDFADKNPTVQGIILDKKIFDGLLESEDGKVKVESETIYIKLVDFTIQRGK